MCRIPENSATFAHAERKRTSMHALPSSEPTTGVDNFSVKMPHGRNVLVKEIGGAVMGLWPKYIGPEVGGVAVFLDASNRAQVSSSAMELCALLEHKEAKVSFWTNNARPQHPPTESQHGEEVSIVCRPCKSRW